MSFAMPTMTSMYAGGASMYMPGSVAAPAVSRSYAPTMTTAMAAPVATTAVAAPMTTAVAAPQVMTTAVAAPQVMAAPVTTAAPSYVAQSQYSQYGVANTGLVDPKTLEAERIAYEKALAAQLEKQSRAVNEEANIKKQMLAQTRDTQVAQMALQLEEQLKMASLQVDKQAMDTLNGLK